MTVGDTPITLDTAASVVTTIEEAVRALRLKADECGDSRAVAHIAAGRRMGHTPPPTRVEWGPADRSHMLQTAAVGIRWQRGSRMACLVDPTVAEECSRGTADAMPTSILRQLPYSDPLVVFADPIPCRTTDDRAAQLLGFFLFGMHSVGDDRDGFLCSTHDNPASLGIMAVLELLDGSGLGCETNRFLMT